jgi:hypothetical protein
METLQPPDQTSARVIEAYCALLDSPAARLKFIRRAVARLQAEEMSASRWPLFDRFRLRQVVVEELVPLLPSGAPAPLAVRVALLAYRLRFGIYAAAACALLVAVTGAGYGVVRLALARGTPTASASIPEPASRATPDGTAVADLPQYAPDQIWLVEKGDGYEVYSNGARVLTEYETEGPARRYFAFPRGGSDPEAGVERGGAPAGIVFHTSQSHIAPFKEEYNQKLQTSSRALLDFVRKHRLYHYVIDRFGRIYRVVRDDCVADHAGNSVWADDAYTYLDLSDGFLGICFEAEWTPDLQIAPDQINEAQIYAGRVLTAMLRSKYRIAEADCVTHALVSVSPAARLIGFHMDWGHAFPFAALGLSNKYETETPSVAEFGFDHDGAFDRAVGDPWPGIAKAESRLADEATRRGSDVAALRRDLQTRYRAYKAWLARRVPDGGLDRELADGGPRQ